MEMEKKRSGNETIALIVVVGCLAILAEVLFGKKRKMK
jgi:hypothetical protein